MPLPREHLLDELATAYVQAVTAAAGATIAVSRLDFGVDGTLSHVVRAKRTRSPGDKFIPAGFSVDFQLKGTTVARMRGDRISYDLKVRNYDLIVRRSSVATPLYLFLICFDPDIESWIAIQDEQLILRASAFWWRHSTETTRNTSTVNIEVPVANRLTSRAIVEMLEASKNRFDLQ